MSKIMGQRIREKRQAAGLSREELGSLLGVSRQTVYNWENGDVKNIDRDYIGKMATMFHCDPEWLMHMEDSPKVTATYEAPGKEPVTVTVNKLPIMGPSSLRAQLYNAAADVSQENLPTAIKILQSLAAPKEDPPVIVLQELVPSKLNPDS